MPGERVSDFILCFLTLLFNAIVVRVRPANVGHSEPIARMWSVDAQASRRAVRLELQRMDLEPMVRGRVTKKVKHH